MMKRLEKIVDLIGAPVTATIVFASKDKWFIQNLQALDVQPQPEEPSPVPVEVPELTEPDRVKTE